MRVDPAVNRGSAAREDARCGRRTGRWRGGLCGGGAIAGTRRCARAGDRVRGRPGGELTGYVGYHIHLELARGETFVALGAGDSAAVDVAAEGPHVMLKPKAARVATNLTLVSSRRVYHFEYRTLRGAAAVGHGDLRAQVPVPAAPSGVTPAATTRAVQLIAADDRSAGRRTVAPVRPVNRTTGTAVRPGQQPTGGDSDDGVQTRLTFSARGEWPAIFVRNADGSESLVNFHAEGTTAVVHRVARSSCCGGDGWWAALRIAATPAVVRTGPGGAAEHGVVREVRP